MARRSSQTRISLFPFLAVLVCTMGALILLLLVTTRRMNQQSDTPPVVADATPPTAEFDHTTDDVNLDQFVLSLETTGREPSPTGQNQIETESSQLSIALLPPDPVPDSQQAQKRQTLSELQQQLHDHQQRHSELKSEIQDVKKRLARSTADAGSYPQQMQELSRLQGQQSELEQLLADKQRVLGQLQTALDQNSKTIEDAENLLKARESALLNLREIAEQTPDIGAAGTDQTVVEFSNSTGTHRSPIIVDVTDAGFRFLPAGIRITSEDMEGFPGNDNPLLAAVLAVHEHRHADSVSIKPYVLLLVRPDGSMPFYTAQRTLNDAGIHFGYELLEQNRKIAAGRADAEEVDTIRQSILAALNRRETLYGGLLAEVQKLKESVVARQQQQQATAAESGGRSIRMTPDGRLLMSDDHAGETESLWADANDGRHYVGGQAPPPPGLIERDSTPYTSDFEGFKQAQNTQATVAAPQPASPAPDFSVFETPTKTTAEQPDAPALASTGTNPFAARDAAAAPFEQPALINNKPGAFSGNSKATSTADNSVDFRRAFRRPGEVAGNLGVGGGDLRTQSTSTAPTQPSWPMNTVQANETDPREPTGWPNSGTAPWNSATRTASPAQDPATQHAFTEQRATSSAKQDPFDGSVLDSSAIASETTGDGLQAGDSGLGTRAYGEPGIPAASESQSFLEKFMQQVEAEKGERSPDPMLVSLLNQGRATVAEPTTDPSSAEPSGANGASINSNAANVPFDWSSTGTSQTAKPKSAEPQTTAAATPKSSAASGQFPLFTEKPSPESTPPPNKTTAPDLSREAQRAEPSVQPQQQTFYVIRVFVEPNRLTIGDYEGVSTAGWDDDDRLALMAEAVSATMDEVWDNINQEALPAVRFLVAPGAEAIQQTLSRQLAEMDVPTRGITPLSAEMTESAFFSATRPPTSGPGSSGTRPNRDPAEPAAVQPRTGRRNSI